MLHLSTDGVTLAQLEARIALIVAPDYTSPYPTCPGNREDNSCFDGQFSCYIELPCKRCVGLQAPHPTNIAFGTITLAIILLLTVTRLDEDASTGDDHALEAQKKSFLPCC